VRLRGARFGSAAESVDARAAAHRRAPELPSRRTAPVLARALHVAIDAPRPAGGDPFSRRITADGARAEAFPACSAQGWRRSRLDTCTTEVA
jgi:hypothetical protein